MNREENRAEDRRRARRLDRFPVIYIFWKYSEKQRKYSANHITRPDGI